MGVENDIFLSEIGTGFGEPGGTPPPRFPHLCPEMHAMAKMAKKSPDSGDLNWMPKVAPWRGLAIMAKNILAPWRLAILAKMVIVAKLAISAKITGGLVISRMWQIFTLDAKSGPFKLDN